MKKFVYLFTAILITSTAVNATTTTEVTTDDSAINYRGYGKNFIFVEGGIEFSIFPDGQFDFYMPNYGPNVNVAVNTPGVSISFNSGYDYNPYVQYDEFGAIIQIENLPIYYDYYGRVVQVGDVFINYNSFGYVSRIGGLYVNYNRYNQFSYCSGFINPFNRVYVYRPWHVYYRIPAYNHCVVYSLPYRQHYTPVRYRFTTPYYNNYRRTTAVASRRGNTIARRSDLATPRDAGRRGSQVATPTNTRRSSVASSTNTRMQQGHSNTRRDLRTTERKERKINTTRTNRNVTGVSRNNNSLKTINREVRKNNGNSQKPNTVNSRKYSSESNNTRNRVASNSSNRRK